MALFHRTNHRSREKTIGFLRDFVLFILTQGTRSPGSVTWQNEELMMPRQFCRAFWQSSYANHFPIVPSIFPSFSCSLMDQQILRRFFYGTQSPWSAAIWRCWVLWQEELSQSDSMTLYTATSWLSRLSLLDTQAAPLSQAARLYMAQTDAPGFSLS